MIKLTYYRRMVDSSLIFDSAVFRLGVLGARWEERYTQSVAPTGVRPKHVALLAAVHGGVAGSQVELAARMRLAPSVIVGLVDDLESLGAVSRTRDPSDRRRQLIAVTDIGRNLLDGARASLARLDAELDSELGTNADSFRTALAALAELADLPVGK